MSSLGYECPVTHTPADYSKNFYLYLDFRLQIPRNLNWSLENYVFYIG